MAEKRKLPPSTMVTRSRNRPSKESAQTVPTTKLPMESRTSSQVNRGRTRRSSVSQKSTSPKSSKPSGAYALAHRRSRQAHNHLSSLGVKPPTSTLAADKTHIRSPHPEAVETTTTASTPPLSNSAGATRASKRICIKPSVDDDSDKDSDKAAFFTPPSSPPKSAALNISGNDDDDSDLGSDSDSQSDDEDLPQYHYEAKVHDEEVSAHGHEYGTELDLVSGCSLDAIAANPNDSLPLSELSGFDKLFMDTIGPGQTGSTPAVAAVTAEAVSPEVQVISERARWPINKQDETIFAALLNREKGLGKDKSTAVAVASAASSPSTSVMHSPELSASMSSSSSSSSEVHDLDDFVNYDSLSLDDSDSDGSDNTLSSPVDETRPGGIPLCGYRNRNKSKLTLRAPANNKAFMAVLSSMADGASTMSSTALYQQALIAASGLNRRSLMSGRAREMVGGFRDDFLA